MGFRGSPVQIRPSRLAKAGSDSTYAVRAFLLSAGWDTFWDRLPYCQPNPVTYHTINSFRMTMLVASLHRSGILAPAGCSNIDVR